LNSPQPADQKNFHEFIVMENNSV